MFLKHGVTRPSMGIIANGQGVSAVRCFSHLTIGTMKYALWHLNCVVCSWAAISNEYTK